MPVFVVPMCLLTALGAVAGWTWLRRTSQPATVVEAARNFPPVPVVVESPRPAPVKGSVLGQFEVPSLQLSWVVLEGTDDATLEGGVGHVTGTAGIGEAGNIGIAGHRNTHFRKLEWIRRGDEILLKPKESAFRYRVNYVRTHKPTDVDVLDRTYGPAVTLITCFPFEYVGSAPLRLIVRAVAVEESVTRLLAPPRAGY
jgi:sortase A